MDDQQPERPGAEEYAVEIQEVLGDIAPGDRQREAVEREYASVVEEIRELLETWREWRYAEALKSATYPFMVGSEADVRKDAGQENAVATEASARLGPAAAELKKKYAAQLRRLQLLRVVRNSLDDSSGKAESH